MGRIGSTTEFGGQVLLVACLVLALGAATARAAEEGALHGKANNDMANVASLQRGARNFVNYCSGCHSAKYVRYNQLARDLDMTEDQVINNLMFAASKPQETMTIAMRPRDAERWFGVPPPDLSLIARARGTDYLYNFLRAFYLDPSRPAGVNNLLLQNVAMPHVLWELQGEQQAIYETVERNGAAAQAFQKFELVRPGKLSPEEFDGFVRDTVNFLDYIGEPMKMKRESLGVPVIAFLLVFGLFAYLLKQEIWKDIK